MKSARGLLIFSYGLFTIAAQALLFREFITTFEGNDISVGIFFGTWFLWVGWGAILVYRAKSFARKLLSNIEFLFLAYLPAFILQFILIMQARELAGIQAYALLSIRNILLLSIVVNAPVSIITGLLFPTACRWFQQDRNLPVSRVFIIEAAGSFLGGLGATVLLAFGISLATIFFILAFIVTASAFVVQIAKIKQYDQVLSEKYSKIKTLFVLLILLCILPCFALRIDKTLMYFARVTKWAKLLPAESYIGSFQTAQAEYLYGIYRGQWVAVRQGSVVETIPDQSTAGRIVAIALCQYPDARRVLVIGTGLGLCRQFLQLPQVEQVTWAHCDNEYMQKIDTLIPPELKITDKRFDKLSGDVRSLLAGKNKYYDLVILNLPDATSSVLNRYYTIEFYNQVRQSLTPDGLLAVRMSGGENIMGTELATLGASTKLTLAKVFSQLVLTPGDETWFIASDSKNLTGSPGILKDRFSRINGAGSIFPPAALLSVYLPDRAEAAMQCYAAVDLPGDLLINRDSKPLTNLYSLLFAAKQSGSPVAKFVKLLALAGAFVFVVPILVFVLLRTVFILKTAQQAGILSSFDSSFLIFSAGWTGIGVVIVLMYIYQTCFGSLYLYIGVISSLFMIGLTAGAALTKLWITGSSRQARPEMTLFAVIFVHISVLGVVAFWPPGQWTHLAFAVAFMLSGVCSGCYWPLAADRLADSGFESGRAGSKLETADHIGAAAGALLTSLALVPVLGTRLTLFIFAMLILANAPLAALKIFIPQRICSSDSIAFRLRRLGYFLFGLAACVVLCSNLLTNAGSRLRPSLPQTAAHALVGQLRLEPASSLLADGSKRVNYFKVYQTEDNLAGFVFSSEDLAPQVRGFGGKINLAVYVDTTGRLIDFHIIRSNETPAYLEMLTKWQELLRGHQLFQSQPFTGLDAVTGATISSKAILSALTASGSSFSAQILGRALQPQQAVQKHWPLLLPDTEGIYLIIAFVLTILVIYRGGFWTRLLVLLFDLVSGGIVLNAQYSSEQIINVLSLHVPAAALTGVFFLAVAVPLLVIIFGNIYCGYLCPFGALQELVSYIVPERFKPPLPIEKMRKARFVKYVVLFVLVMLFFLSMNRTTLTADPLIEFFSPSSILTGWQSSMLAIFAIALIGSLFYTRFWCRYFCPVGAFLSLFNNLIILKRLTPPKRFANCQFGLTAKDKMDCLFCDRCRYTTATAVKPQHLPRAGFLAPLSRYFVLSVIILAGFVAAVSVNKFLQVTSISLEQPVVSASSGGQPRDVDLQRINTMIQRKQLSDKEADFYKKTD